MSLKSLLTARKKFEREMREVRDAGGPWFKIAERLGDEFDSAVDGDVAADMKAAAEDGTGLSGQILGRYVSLLGRIRRIATEEGVAVESLLSPVFNAQEVAARLYDRAPEIGIESLLDLAAGSVTLAVLRKRLEDAPSGAVRSPESARAAVARAKAENTALLERALKASAPALWGRGSRIRQRPRLTVVGSAGYEVVGTESSMIAGIDILDIDVRMNDDRFSRNLFPSVLLSTFYPRFYLGAVSAPDRSAVMRTMDAVEWLGLEAVGVLEIRSDESVVELRAPRGGPVPDRTAKYNELKIKYPGARRTPSGP
jgi:hypothetical protein